MLGEIASWNSGRPGFEHHDSDAALSEFLGNPSSTGAGTDDQDVVDAARRGHEGEV